MASKGYVEYIDWGMFSKPGGLAESWGISRAKCL